MILPVIGTHGSGKSTLVYNIVRQYTCHTPMYDVGAKRIRKPVRVIHERSGLTPLAIIGSYEAGHFSGIDSGRFAGRLPEVYGWVAEHAEVGEHVMFEGILALGTMRRIVRLHETGRQVCVLALTLSLADCVEALEERKRARGDSHKNSPLPVNLKIVEAKRVAVDKVVRTLSTLGVPVFAGSRAVVRREAFRLLGFQEVLRDAAVVL